MEAHLCELFAWYSQDRLLDDPVLFMEGYTERNDQLLSLGVRGDRQVSLLWGGGSPARAIGSYF